MYVIPLGLSPRKERERGGGDRRSVLSGAKPNVGESIMACYCRQDKQPAKEVSPRAKHMIDDLWKAKEREAGWMEMLIFL